MTAPPLKSPQSTLRQGEPSRRPFGKFETRQFGTLEQRPFGSLGSISEPNPRVVVGRALQALRDRYFRLHPLCRRCELAGRVTAATVLDHILALENGGLDVDANRQGLCHPCHVEKTNEDNMVHRALSSDGASNVVPIR